MEAAEDKDDDEFSPSPETDDKETRHDRFGVEIVSRKVTKQLNKKSGHKVTFVD